MRPPTGIVNAPGLVSSGKADDSQTHLLFATTCLYCCCCVKIYRTLVSAHRRPPLLNSAHERVHAAHRLAPQIAPTVQQQLSRIDVAARTARQRRTGVGKCTQLLLALHTIVIRNHCWPRIPFEVRDNWGAPFVPPPSSTSTSTDSN